MGQLCICTIENGVTICPHKAWLPHIIEVDTVIAQEGWQFGLWPSCIRKDHLNMHLIAISLRNMAAGC